LAGARRAPASGRRRIKAVLFDYGGTLFKATKPWEEVRAEGLAAAHEALRKGGAEVELERLVETTAAVFKRYAEVEAKEDRDIADRIKYGEVVDELFPDLSKAKRAALASKINKAFWDTATKRYPLRKGARETLEALSSAGVRMAVVSNHHNYESLVGHLRESGIHGHFRVILASEREGVRKPNPAMFARSLRALGVEKDEALFVGDSPRHDIVGARASGITAVLIDDGERPDSWVLVGEVLGPEGEPDYVIRELRAIRDVVESERRRLRKRKS
jgi:HAD superfamily hydrolase (TIGR01509 family)